MEDRTAERHIPIPNCFVCPFFERIELPKPLNTLDGRKVNHLMKCGEQDKTFDIDDMGMYQMFEVHESCPLPRTTKVTEGD